MKLPTAKSKAPKSLSSLFENLWRNFSYAWKSSNSKKTRFFNIAGHSLQFRVIGEQLEHTITKAFSHLEEEISINSDAIVNCFSGFQNIESEELLNSIFELFSQKPFNNGNENPTLIFQNRSVHAAYQPGRGSLDIYFPEIKQAITWISDPDSLINTDGHPLRSIMHWFLNTHGKQIIHAGAVGLKNGGVILTGKSGAGKSTATLACLGSELKIIGDENIVVRLGGKPHAYSLYNSVNIDDKSMKLLPKLNTGDLQSSNKVDDKNLLYLVNHHSNYLAAGFPIKAIIVPVVNKNQKTEITELSRSIALAAIAPTSIFQLPGGSKEAFSKMTNLVRAIPSYKLQLGVDVDRIPVVILELLEEIEEKV